MNYRTTIEFYYDIVSPYSLIAYKVLQQYTDIWNIKLVLKPVFLGGIMNGADNHPPATIPFKAMYSAKDLTRQFALLGLQHKRYTGSALQVMSNSLKTMRLVTAVANKYPQHLGVFSFALSERFWCHGIGDIIERSGWSAAAKQAHISEQQLDELIKLSETAEIKKQLTDTTNTVIDAKGFGAPTFFIHTDQSSKTSQPHPLNEKQHIEMVFGSDRMETVAYLLNKPYRGMQPNKPHSKL